MLAFLFGIAGDEDFFLAFNGFSAAEAIDPGIHVSFELICRAERIYAHGAEEVPEPFAHGVRGSGRKLTNGGAQGP